MYISISCITAFYGFRPYGGSLLSNSHKSKQKGLAPCVRLSLRSSSLAPVPLRGHAVTGHPWPNTALPASMPVDPLRRTSSRPPDGAADQDQKPDHKQIKIKIKIKSRSRADQNLGGDEVIYSICSAYRLLIKLCRQCRVNQAPPLSRLRTSSVKPCRLTIAATMDNPRPKPAWVSSQR